MTVFMAFCSVWRVSGVKALLRSLSAFVLVVVDGVTPCAGAIVPVVPGPIEACAGPDGADGAVETGVVAVCASAREKATAKAIAMAGNNFAMGTLVTGVLELSNDKTGLARLLKGRGGNPAFLDANVGLAIVNQHGVEGASGRSGTLRCLNPKVGDIGGGRVNQRADDAGG